MWSYRKTGLSYTPCSYPSACVISCFELLCCPEGKKGLQRREEWSLGLAKTGYQ